MKAHELVARFAAAVGRPEPMAAARAELEELKGNIAEVDDALRYISGVGGNARQVFYRSPDLTLLKVCFPAGRRTPPRTMATAAADERGFSQQFAFSLDFWWLYLYYLGALPRLWLLAIVTTLAAAIAITGRAVRVRGLEFDA